MARLIVEESGRTRRFRLNEGRLTIGSGAAATLTLESDQIAEVHAELEYRDGEAVLRPRKGVAPVTVSGRQVAGGEIALRPGTVVRIGDVRLSIEEEDVPLRSAPQPRAAAGAASPRSAAPRSGAAGGRAGSDPLVSAPRRTIQRGPSVPSWLIVVGLLAAAGGGYLMLDRFAQSSSEGEFSAKASDVRIRMKLEAGNFQGVLAEFEEKIDRQQNLDPEWKRVFEGHRARALEMQRESTEQARNTLGNKWFGSQLDNYVKGYLKDNGRPQARVLMARMKLFRERYPTHPKLEWCDRMERRYAGIADMASPPTFDDVEWEVKTMTWAKPRDYRSAFAVLERFYQTAEGVERDTVLTLMQEKEAEQQEYFDDRLQEAKYQWERKKNYGQAVEELVQLVLKLSDEEMVQQAAQRIVQLPGVESALAGYKKDRPADFEVLERNDSIRAFCQEKGIL